MKLGVCGLVLGLAAVPAAAQERPEIAIGLLDHGVRKPFRAAPPTGFDLYEGEEERGSVDVQLVYRTAPLGFALKPRLTARLQVNTEGGTNFASLGAEWRQHVLQGRVYGQIGIGLAVHDGYRFTPDPFAPGLALAEALRRLEIEATRTSFGSRVLFNPNLSVGVTLSERVAVEAAFEHFSHAALFSAQNPGINNIGLRLVVALGK
nr:acyloxyacyl hydrolase [Polymorphobacter multimanifer]